MRAVLIAGMLSISANTAQAQVCTDVKWTARAAGRATCTWSASGAASYWHAYETVGEAKKGIADYLRYFNEEYVFARKHPRGFNEARARRLWKTVFDDV